MKGNVLLITAVLGAAFLPAEAQVPSQDQTKPSEGEVVAATGMECSNYFAVKTDDGYVLLEWYGGHMPEKGEKLRGEFGRFGFEELSVQPGGANLRAYVADYGLSLDDADDKLKDKCN